MSDYVDLRLESPFEVDVVKALPEADAGPGAPVVVKEGRYRVIVVRHYPSRLIEGGIRSGDIWYALDRGDDGVSWVRAVETTPDANIAAPTG